MNKNQLVYTLQSARWKGVLGERPPAAEPVGEEARPRPSPAPARSTPTSWGGPSAMPSGRTCNSTAPSIKRRPCACTLTSAGRRFSRSSCPTEIVRTDDLAIGRSARAGQGGMVEAANALRARLRSNEREETDRDYIEQLLRPQHLRSAAARPHRAAAAAPETTSAATCGSRAARRRPTSRGAPTAEHLAEQAAEQARLNRAAYARDSELYQSALLRLTEQIRNCMLVHQPAGRRPRAAGTARRRACLA